MKFHLIQINGGARLSLQILETKEDQGGIVVSEKEKKPFFLKWHQFSFVIPARHD